ncbi:MAG: MiaB/RimO family radical SAM methylthiotransferase, partial [Candidatus Aminicenantes bacterium]
PPAWAYVKISEGCSHQCSFCAIPLIKGAYRSRSISSIVQEVKELASKGVKEINLVSQDSTYFYRDISLDNGLPILLKELLGIKKLEWIRILYGHPEEISAALLDIMKEEKICSYLDIPFQHSDPFIIKKMKRGLDGKRALKLLQKIRKKLPGIAIRTSLVVGFPGEGEKEFDDLSNFIKEAKFDHMGVFTYSREEGTDCFTSGDPVKESEKRRRKDEIMAIQAEISYQANKKYLNQKIDVLIEGTSEADDRVLLARGMFQAPEVDGVVFINLEGKVPDVINTVHRVEIIDTDIYDLYGNLIK